MKETILVLGVTAYKFADERTGEMREGAHIHYLNNYAFNEPNKKGTLPTKMSAALSIFEDVETKQFPAICDLESISLPDGKGQPKLTPVKIHYTRPVSLFAESVAKV